jgi:hypothetical protein
LKELSERLTREAMDNLRQASAAQAGDGQKNGAGAAPAG